MVQEKRTRDIALPSGGSARLMGDQLMVFEAVEHCCRRRADATRLEALEVVATWIGRPALPHVWSGRFSELVALGALEKAPEKRDDVGTIRLRAATGRASRVTAWRLPVVQQRLVA